MEFLTDHFGKLILLVFGGTLFITSIYNGIPVETKLQEISGILTSVNSYNGSNSTRYTEIQLDSSTLTFHYSTDSNLCGNVHDKLTNLKLKPLTIKYSTYSGWSESAIYVVYDTWSEHTPICAYSEISAKRELKDTFSLYLGLGAILYALFSILRKVALT
jgi:hypothetical protein